MQKDCNLVLYEHDDAIWESNTPEMGSNCSLVLQSNGELHIFSDVGAPVWRTETSHENGKYALVLQPNGNVVVYGSPIWSTGTHTQTSTLLSSSILLILIASCSSTWFGYPASPGNVLRSGEELSIGKSLSIGNYTLTMRKDCNLVLYENDDSIWESNTSEMGRICSLVLQSNGELQILSELAPLVWKTETGTGNGNYALVLQPNGNVVIYGSPIWSTGTHTKSKTLNAPRTNFSPKIQNP
ncbi:Mannose-specific lectin 1 [Dendrobium catenatum]|uniref:Mannose-specific lectin 1 n=1 Tax=Dendrobium catenatum TaxID=906689 RepID=A0A2I0VLE1_9ASPA|nr:Mannose-specific lectin 1 [Dendrobium catenatum]